MQNIILYQTIIFGRLTMTLAVPDYFWLHQVNESRHKIIHSEHAKLKKNRHTPIVHIKNIVKQLTI